MSWKYVTNKQHLIKLENKQLDAQHLPYFWFSEVLAHLNTLNFCFYLYIKMWSEMSSVPRVLNTDGYPTFFNHFFTSNIFYSFRQRRRQETIWHILLEYPWIIIFGGHSWEVINSSKLQRFPTKPRSSLITQMSLSNVYDNIYSNKNPFLKLMKYL